MTLQVDLPSEIQAYYDELRNKYFPKHKLRDQAHLTLLYQVHLPEAIIIERLNKITVPKFTMEALSIKAFPFGNAIVITCPELINYQKSLKKLFQYKLSKRDFIKYNPHITIQLDVTAYKAQLTLQELKATFIPKSFVAPGISLWNKHKNNHTCLWKSYT